MARRIIPRIRLDHPDFMTVDYLRMLRAAFVTQRGNAHERGIAFELSWPEWLRIWVESGHLHERGCKRGEYVMARIGDRGPYAVGNIMIIPNAENISACHRGKIVSAETRRRLSIALRASWINRRLAYCAEARA